MDRITNTNKGQTVKIVKLASKFTWTEDLTVEGDWNRSRSKIQKLSQCIYSRLEKNLMGNTLDLNNARGGGCGVETTSQRFLGVRNSKQSWSTKITFE